MSAPSASALFEQSLADQFGVVAGVDEVGRGSLAGPVAVGVALTSPGAADPPAGLADSKALTAKRREALAPAVRQWALDCAVGWAGPDEIDQWGIVAALRLAGLRALDELAGRGRVPGAVVLDGSHNWLAMPEDLLGGLGGPDYPPPCPAPIRTRVKADASCAVVAAASVIAKVERDRLMAELDDPGYEWSRNKGYASAAHIAALGELGPSAHHRRSWKLPARARK